MHSVEKFLASADSNAVFNSPLNSSTAKIHWSFARSSRFPRQKPNCDSIYDLPSRHTRATSFGFGDRSHISPEESREMPASNTYHIDSFVDIDKRRRIGVKMANSREETGCQGIYYKGNSRDIPGPGSYYLKRQSSKETPVWSMAPKTASFWNLKESVKLEPGPGAYHESNLNPEGRYSLSKNKNSTSAHWNPKHSKRFTQKYSRSPGPGAYNPRNDLSSSGDYVLSKNTSSGKRRILLSRRDSFIDEARNNNRTPGPGSYQLPSDFGLCQLMGSSGRMRHARSQIIARGRL